MNGRKRPALTVILAVAIFASAFVIGKIAAAPSYNNVILMVSGLDVLVPEDNTMPFWYVGKVYAPVLLFSRQKTTVKIAKDELILSNFTHTLVFDTAAGTVTNERGETFSESAVYKNGSWFVPAMFAAEKLDVYYSYYNVVPVPFIRIATKDFFVKDEDFLPYYPEIARARLKDYTPATSEERTGSSSSGGTSVSTQKPAVSTARPPRNYTAYLVVNGLAECTQILDIFKENGVKASFCVDEGDILQNEELIRRAAVEGHGFVLKADGYEGESVEAVVSRLEKANRALFEISKTVSRVAFFTARGGSDGNADALTAAGYRLWEGGYDVDGAAERQDWTLLNSYMEKNGSSAVILLRPGANIAAGLNSIAEMFEKENTRYFAITPLMAPVNGRNDLR